MSPVTKTKAGKASTKTTKGAASKGATKTKAKTGGKPAGKTSASSNGSTGKIAGWDEAVKTTRKTWAAASKVKGNDFDQPEIEDGTYVARLAGATFGVFKAKPAKGNPKSDDYKPAQPASVWFRMSFVIARGEYEGLQPSRLDVLTDADEDKQRRNQENFCKTVQALGYETTDSDGNAAVDPNDLPDLAKQLIAEKPLVQLRIKAWTGGLNVYVNKTLDASEA